MRLDRYARPPSLTSVEVTVLASAMLGSVALGATVAVSPTVAVGLFVVCIALVAAVRRPVVLFAAAIVLLAIEPARIFGATSFVGRAETYKLILYACTIPLVLKRGLVAKKCSPLFAYVTVAILAWLLGSPLAELSLSQTVASLMTLCLGWLIFAIDWDWRRDHGLLKVLAWMPIISVLLGAGLDAIGRYALFRGSSPPRLEGATIAAWLGTFSLCGVVASIALYRRSAWMTARSVGSINVLILGATLTRGAVLALCIAGTPALIRFGQRQLGSKGMAGTVRLAVILIVAVGGTVVLVSGLRERTEDATSHVAGGGGVHDGTSGRLRAWSFAYEQAKVNLAFGRGIGAGPLVGRSPGSPAGFTAQHNEYVRMLLEGGIVGAVLLLLTMLTTMTAVIRCALPMLRADLAAAGIAFAIYSVTENTLSATPISVALFLYFGVAGAGAALGSGRTASA